MKKKIIVVLIILFIIGLLVIAYSRWIGVKGLKVKEYKIVESSLIESYNGIKIVHLSDIHYGMTINKKELQEIVNKVNLINPDIVVFTGDLFDKDATYDMVSEITELFGNIDARLGKYAISGNHDYNNIDSFNEVIANSGFVNLNDSYDLIYYNSNEPILISGISSNIYGDNSIEDKIKPTITYLDSEESKSIYNILLIHEPDYIDNIDYNRFNLILSGHSHNGQVRLPLIGAIYKVYGAKKYYDEYYELNNTNLYISSGLGTTMLRLRLFNTPSINFYRITKK